MKRLLCGGAFAQDWKSGSEKTVAAAKEEGALVIGIPSSAGHREFVQSAWAQAYPDFDRVRPLNEWLDEATGFSGTEVITGAQIIQAAKAAG